MEYKPVIGLEVHVQLKTNTKLFCGCLTKFGAPPNSQTCPVCLGLPGVLPVMNERVLEWGLRVAVAFECKVTSKMKFDRKQYFYPDLPKNYQISQFDLPLCQKGKLMILLDGKAKTIRIHRIHIEEDAGKLLHEGNETSSRVDFNRAGVPLLEIVSEADMRSSDEAYQYLTELKAIVQYLDVSTCNMEEGSLRCDTNISLRKSESDPFGSKVEIKNLNSFKAVKQSIEYEIKRQSIALDQNERIVQETRLWDAKRLRTDSMRSKEEAADYRYFPEPDLVPFMIDQKLIDEARKSLPELPAQRRKRFESEFQLSAYDAQVLTQDRLLADFFEQTTKIYSNPKSVTNWIMGDLSAYLNANNKALADTKVTPATLAQLLKLIDEKTITGKIAKELLIPILEEGAKPAQLVKEKGLQQIADDGTLEKIAAEVLEANPTSVESYLSGKENAIMRLVGDGMKRTKGRANPQQFTEILKKKLQSSQQAR